MILVKFGTNPYPFERLAQAVIALADAGHQCTVQRGNTCLRDHPLISQFDFCPRSELEQHEKKAEYIVCQGGVGSILESLAQKKPVFVCPRKVSLGESLDDQYEFVTELRNQGLITVFEEPHLLLDLIVNYRSRHIEPLFQSRIPGIVKELTDRYLEDR